ncbi:protein TITANIA-like [Typha latifolia]|uniref:protein TITANIA-like n=1 Tax=Typha latifolia TaxID=4733 RepID=UPI003C2B2A6C
MIVESNSQSNPKPLDLKNPDPKSRPFPDGVVPAPKIEPPNPQELTLSYLCENPKLNLHDKGPSGGDLLSTMEKSRSKGKEIVSDSPADEEKQWIERDFLQLAGGKRDWPDRINADCREKKVKMEPLNLSLSLPDLSLSLNSSKPAKRSCSGNIGTVNSDDYGAASLSYSCSVPFSHNPSCSLTQNFSESCDLSRENDQMWYGGEGTNGSVHSRFKPVGDGNSITFLNPSKFTHKELGSNLCRGNSSENVSFFPSELPMRRMKANGFTSSDSGRNVMLAWPDRILREIVSESVPVMAQILHDFSNESLEALRETVRQLIDVPERKDEFASLQRKLERRSDLTLETLSKSHRTQLEILVAIKMGITNFVSGKTRLPSAELVEIFLLMRCKNMNCKNLLPIDDCECKICTTKKGFCSACMCPVCLKFDCASNTCSWVGCDVCSHWCHAVCGLEKNLIRPGQSPKGPIGMTEMQFQCLGCGHTSEMFGFVKEVFNCCAKQWGLETLMKELDCVRKIFCASEDFEGKGLHSKAEEALNKLSKRVISPSDACDSMLQFFRYGVTEFSVTGSTSKKIFTAQASKLTDALPLASPSMITPLNSNFNFQPTSSMLDTQICSVKTEIKPLATEHHFIPSKEDDFQSLETIVKFKEEEAKLFQRLADDARREVEGYLQIVRAKSEKLEEEYETKLANLCLQATEEKRRKKLEELKMLENSHCDYHKMKMRMQAEIASLLQRMEATKKTWV